MAQRIPDDHVTVTANLFSIREIDLDDEFQFLGTPIQKMIEHANKAGIKVHYGPNGRLDFAKTFSNGEYDHKYYSGRRMWRALTLMAPSLMSNFGPYYTDVFEANYPWSVRPEIDIDEHVFYGIHRDYYGENPWLGA